MHDESSVQLPWMRMYSLRQKNNDTRVAETELGINGLNQEASRAFPLIPHCRKASYARTTETWKTRSEAGSTGWQFSKLPGALN